MATKSNNIIYRKRSLIAFGVESSLKCLELYIPAVCVCVCVCVCLLGREKREKECVCVREGEREAKPTESL